MKLFPQMDITGIMLKVSPDLTGICSTYSNEPSGKAIPEQKPQI
jgi:hypothetical protein